MLLAVNSTEAWRSLYASKQRTLLALLGVIIGIGSVMAMLSIGETVKNQALNQFKLMGTDILTVTPGFGGGDQVKVKPLLASQFDLIAKYSRYIREVSPEVDAWGDVISGQAKISPGVKGVRPVFQDVNRLKMARGRFFTRFDRQKAYVVLGNLAARELIEKGAKPPLNEVILGGMPYEVIGRLAPADLGFRSDEVDRSVFLPLEMAARLSSSEGLSKVVVRLKPNASHREATKQIEYMAGLLMGEGSPLMVDSPKKLLEQMDKQMQLYTLLLAAVASISLVVGGVGIMNMMLVSVTERRREIGIRRAMGAKRGDITSQFLVESVLLSLVGGLIGIGLGVAACFITADLNSWTPILPVKAMLLCLGVALGVGFFFGYYPARKAAKLDVIIALRSE